MNTPITKFLLGVLVQTVMESSDRILKFSQAKYVIMLCHIETDCSIFNTAKDKIESRYKRTLRSPPSFSGVRVTRSSLLCVCFVDRCLSFCPFYFGYCVVCSSIYGFWLPLWYLQTLLITNRCVLESSESYLFMCILYVYTMGDISVTWTAYPWEAYKFTQWCLVVFVLLNMQIFMSNVFSRSFCSFLLVIMLWRLFDTTWYKATIQNTNIQLIYSSIW
jgi:hypothetical protein